MIRHEAQGGNRYPIPDQVFANQPEHVGVVVRRGEDFFPFHAAVIDVVVNVGDDGDGALGHGIWLWFSVITIVPNEGKVWDGFFVLPGVKTEINPRKLKEG